MRDMLAEGEAWLHSQIKESASSLGSIQRGAFVSTLPLTISPRTTAVEGSQRAAIVANGFDFVADPREYVFNGAVSKPASNDKICFCGAVYVVTKVDGECSRPSGTDGTRIRIHANLAS